MDLLRQVQTHAKLLERAAQYIRAGDSVLDVGCGTGLLLERLPPSCRYVGLDDRPEVLAVASRRHAARRDAEFRLYQPETPEFASPVDVVVILDTVHRIGAGAVRLLKAASRSLAPGGTIIVSGPATVASVGGIEDFFRLQLAAKEPRIQALLESWRGDRGRNGYFCSAEGMAALLGHFDIGRILEAGHDIHYGLSFFVAASRWNRAGSARPDRRGEAISNGEPRRNP